MLVHFILKENHQNKNIQYYNKYVYVIYFKIDQFFSNKAVINLYNMVDLSYTTIEITCDNSPFLMLC